MSRLGLLLAFLLLSTPASSEMHKWVDDQGRLHFSQELHQVPEKYRAQARRNTVESSGPGPVQTFSPPASMTGSAARSLRTRGVSKQGRSYRIPVEKTGTMLRVMVRINDAVDAPFYIDTGASDVVVPRWVMERAGVELDGTRTARYSTANGVIEVPVVTLDAVELRGARVEQVPAAVSDSMQVGLLGLAYFNHFQYSVDPGAGVVILRENHLAEQGVIRGGRSKPQWRSQFAGLAMRRDHIERQRSDTPRSHSRAHERFDRMLEELDRQYELLDGEADDARVPFSWRD